MGQASNVIPFPARNRQACNDLELLRGAMRLIDTRLDGVEELDDHTRRYALNSLTVIVDWLKRKG